jgi:hypothetical protein
MSRPLFLCALAIHLLYTWITGRENDIPGSTLLELDVILRET